jgi:hypothetical protein
MTKLWAPLIQKARKLAPREEVKSLVLKRRRSTKGEAERSSTPMNKRKQKKLNGSHPQKR